jgi:competence protein ComEC
MRRPFFGPGLSLAVGILGGRLLGLPETPVFLLTLFLLPFLWFFRGRRIFIPLFLGAIAGLGVLRIEGAFKLPSHHVSHFAQGDWVSLEGRVASLPEVKEKGKRRIYSFVLESENLIQNRKFFESTGKIQVFLFNPQEKASYGNRVRMRGKLLSPKRPQNPGEFDYGHYLRDQGIHAVFEGYGPRSLRIIETKVAFYQLPLAAVQRLRDACSERLDSAFSLPWNVLLKALILGIRKGLPEEFRDDFMKTGTTHLIAISGMNITLVAGSLFFLAMVLGLPQKGAALVGLLATVGYVFLSGAGIPVVRAGWMAGLFFTGLLMEREKDWMNSLFFALFLILAFDPRALFQVGFQLSFLCVFFLLSLASNLQRDWHVDWLGTVIIIIGTFPLCVLYFSVFSWTSLFANLLAVPLFHLGVLSGLASLMTSGIPYLGPLGVSIATLFLKAGG